VTVEIGFHTPSNIGEFTVGRVVQLRRIIVHQSELYTYEGMVGHVVGFGHNHFQEVTVLVKIPVQDDPIIVHPSNLMVRH
jgi:hypothetical protein